MVVDFRRRKSTPTPISIKGTTAEVVLDYKYLGVHLDNKLDWSKNTEAVYKPTLLPAEAPVLQRL